MKSVLKFLSFTALMGIVITSCQQPTYKAGIIRSGSGYILATNVPKGPRLVMAKWDVMKLRRFKDEATTNADIVVDSVVVAVQLGDTLRDKLGHPVYDSTAKIWKADTLWTVNGLQNLTLSYLYIRTNPQP